MATRKEVAQLAGVSDASVSYVINNSGYVSQERREKILAAIKELNYTPNQVAQSLKTKKSNLMVFMSASMKNEFFAGVANALEKRCYEYGITLISCNARDDLDFIRSIISRQVDGIMVFDGVLDDSIIRMISSFNIPMVIVGYNSDKKPFYNELQSPISFISIDVYTSFYKATQLLIDKGHTNIAYVHLIKINNETALGSVKFRAFKKCLADNQIQLKDEYVFNSVHSSYDLKDIVFHLLNLNPRPTAILAGNDIIAIKIMEELYTQGLQVPQDAMIIGCDDISYATLVKKSLTTIRIPKEEIGIAAADLLSRKRKTRVVSIDTQLIERQTT